MTDAHNHYANKTILNVGKTVLTEGRLRKNALAPVLAHSYAHMCKPFLQALPHSIGALSYFALGRCTGIIHQIHVPLFFHLSPSRAIFSKLSDRTTV